MATAAAAVALWSPAASAETKSFVVSWLYQGVYSQDGDCPQGFEPSVAEMYTKIFMNAGKTKEEADKLMTVIEKGGAATQGEAHELIAMRGRVDGKPVDVYDNPTSVPDPGVHTVVGQYAPGFNLDGKGAASPNSFEDPETHEKGVNNQYFRAVGCFTTHRAAPPIRPQAWLYGWQGQQNAMRAWLISVTGTDLSKDGDVTIAFDKALEPVMFDANSNVQRDQTFRIDVDPRSHNVLRGKMKDGVMTIEPATFHMVGEPYIIPEWNIHNTHMRLKINQDGSLDAVMGGYQSWLQIYYMYAQGGFPYESMVGFNMPGIYYVLRRLADAEPDPKTGQNMAISVAYRIEALPALTVRPGGKDVSSIDAVPAVRTAAAAR